MILYLPVSSLLEVEVNNLVIYVALAIVVLVVLFAIRISRSKRALSNVVSEWCREAGVPDRPLDLDATVRQVVAGKWPGIPRDGQWWIASGIEQIGDSSKTRLMREGTAPSIHAVHAEIEELFDEFGGAAHLPPHLAEGRFIGSMPSIHQDIIYARITGRLRPIGAWLVAVPPWVIGSKL